MELWTVFFRTIFIYVLILIVMRLMGKREVGELSILDLIVSFMIADISSMAIETNVTMMRILVPVVTLALLQVGISYFSLDSPFLRRWVDGVPSILIKNGKIQDDTMKKIRYNIDDLMMQLRQKNVFDVADVEFAILEVDGELSVLPKKGSPKRVHDGLPVPLIVDGKVQEEGLQKIHQTRFWLKRELRKRGVKSFKEVYFASIGYKGDLYLDKKEPRRR